MGEAGPQQRTPAENLLDALKAYVQTVPPPSPSPGASESGGAPLKPPTKTDIFVFLLFACNLAMIVWSVPEEWLKSTQLEFVQNVIPVAGGGLFALIAAWYKEKALLWTRSRRFRWAQIPLTAVAVTLAVPILPVRIFAQPSDAILYVDKDDPAHLREWKRAFRVTLRSHTFILKHLDDVQHTSAQTFERKWPQLTGLFVRGMPVELSMVYPLRFTSLDTPGVTVRITRKSGPFAEDFLRGDVLMANRLEKLDSTTVQLRPAGKNEASMPTHLPVGSYALVSSKDGCRSSKTIDFNVEATLASSLSEVVLPELKECQP